MGADSRGRSKQERSGIAPNKEKHVTEHKPKQTNQTDNLKKRHTQHWYNTKPRKQQKSDKEKKKQKLMQS